MYSSLKRLSCGFGSNFHRGHLWVMTLPLPHLPNVSLQCMTKSQFESFESTSIYNYKTFHFCKCASFCNKFTGIRVFVKNLHESSLPSALCSFLNVKLGPYISLCINSTVFYIRASPRRALTYLKWDLENMSL